MMNRDESCRNEIFEKLYKCQDLTALRSSNEVIGKITNLVSCLGFDIYLMKGGEKINLKQFLEEELNYLIFESVPEKPNFFDTFFDDESDEIDFSVFDDEVLADDTFDSLEEDDIFGDDDFGDLN
jgi:hypothetical protein